WHITTSGPVPCSATCIRMPLVSTVRWVIPFIVSLLPGNQGVVADWYPTRRDVMGAWWTCLGIGARRPDLNQAGGSRGLGFVESYGSIPTCRLSVGIVAIRPREPDHRGRRSTVRAPMTSMLWYTRIRTLTVRRLSRSAVVSTANALKDAVTPIAGSSDFGGP